jgi:hypothetical protein
MGRRPISRWRIESGAPVADLPTRGDPDCRLCGPLRCDADAALEDAIDEPDDEPELDDEETEAADDEDGVAAPTRREPRRSRSNAILWVKARTPDVPGVGA